MFHTAYEVQPAHDRARHVPQHHRQHGDRARLRRRGAARRPAAVPRQLSDHARPATSCTSSRRTRTSASTPSRPRTRSPAIGAAIGAAFGGALAHHHDQRPGHVPQGRGDRAWRSCVELPLVIADIQRGGPSTGLPTKTEQADLLQAMYGRNGESPAADHRRRDARPTASQAAFEAVRIAVKYMTPVILLSDGYLANGAEPWRIPRAADLPTIHASTFRTDPHGYQPYLRDPRDARAPVGDSRHARPRAPHRRPREGGRHRQRQLRAGEPRADGARARRARSPASPPRSRPPTVDGPAEGDLLVARLGQHLRRDRGAPCRSCARAAPRSSHAHLRYLNPLPPRPRRRCSARFKQVLVPELNLGQLVAARCAPSTWSTRSASTRSRAAVQGVARSSTRVTRMLGERS